MKQREIQQALRIENDSFTALLLAEQKFGADDPYTRAVRAYWCGQYRMVQNMGCYDECDKQPNKGENFEDVCGEDDTAADRRATDD